MSTLHDNPWDLFPDHRHLGTEESGNEIVVDLTGGKEGHVYGLWHDPPMVVVLARSEPDFRCSAPGFGDDDPSLPEPVQALVELPNPAQPSSLDAALASLPPAFASWLNSFPPGTRFADLRQGQPGSGFALGPSDTFAKHPEAPVFAIQTPPAKPGLLSRLFGRS